VKFGVVTFPGSNCDYDAYKAVVDVLGEECEFLWHKDHDLRGSDVVVLPGGFSYGDYLRAGAIARFSPIMSEVVAHARRGGRVLAICNGFQIACEAGLLPGALLRNANLQFVSQWVKLRVETAATDFTNRYQTGAILTIPVAHGEGRFTAPQEVLHQLEERNGIVFRYVDVAGQPSAEANPNGSMSNIAGIINESGNVLGMMPHPERAMEPLLGSSDGRALFESILAKVAA
jgi:phosphoribosylformylglycinamidine synthase